VKVKRKCGRRYRNTACRVCNSYPFNGEKIMCEALDFFAVSLYPKHMNCLLSKQG